MKANIGFEFRVHPRTVEEVQAISDEDVINLLHTQYTDNDYLHLWHGRTKEVKEALNKQFANHQLKIIPLNYRLPNEHEQVSGMNRMEFRAVYLYYFHSRDKYEALFGREMYKVINRKINEFGLEPLN